MEIIIGIVAVGLIAALIHDNRSAAKGLICARCGSQSSHTVNNASGWVFLVLLLAGGGASVFSLALGGLLLLVAGLYFVVGILRWKRVCAACGGGDLIPTSSPVGKKMLAETTAQMPPE